MGFIEEGVRGIVDDAGVPNPEAYLKAFLSYARKSHKRSLLSAEPAEVTEIMEEEKRLEPIEKAKNESLRETEAENKGKVLSTAEKPFALCSRHDDCAKDHESYQGKVYVHEWALSDPDIRKWCEENDIKTVEWVTGKPVWMVTRPNCRHFFKDISFEQAQGKVGVMLKEYGMDRVAGSEKGWKTIKHDTRKEWYTEERVAATITKYKNRLRKHERMARVATNENLDNLIKKDKLLLSKWKNYHKTHFKK